MQFSSSYDNKLFNIEIDIKMKQIINTNERYNLE